MEKKKKKKRKKRYRQETEVWKKFNSLIFLNNFLAELLSQIIIKLFQFFPAIFFKALDKHEKECFLSDSHKARMWHKVVLMRGKPPTG